MQFVDEQMWFVISSFIGGFVGGELLIIPLMVLIKIKGANFFLCMLSAVIGTFVRDIILFLSFRYFGHKLLDRFPSIHTKLDKVQAINLTKSNFIGYFYRLFIGLVIFWVILFGLSKIKVKSFLFYALISNLIFITTIGILGYHFTDLMLYLLEFLKNYQFLIALVTFVLVYSLSQFPRLLKYSHLND